MEGLTGATDTERIAPEGSRARLADLLANDRPALVLTGAGMSTASGIPDYRGPDGTRRVTPMSHGEFVGHVANRRRYWARSYAGWLRFSAARPNAGHRAVTALQSLGAVGPVITQNVDGLHQQADTDRVVELHGSLSSATCLDCGARIDRESIQQVMAAANPDFALTIASLTTDGSRESSAIRPDGDVVLHEEAVAGFVVPTCPRCGGDSVKPDVVFFGASVPRERVDRCFALTEAAPALLVLGSSLQVMSGLRFVRRAAARGIPIGIITRGPTRGDDLATHRVDDDLVQALPALVEDVQRR